MFEHIEKEYSNPIFPDKSKMKPTFQTQFFLSLAIVLIYRFLDQETNEQKNYYVLSIRIPIRSYVGMISKSRSRFSSSFFFRKRSETKMENQERESNKTNIFNFKRQPFNYFLRLPTFHSIVVQFVNCWFIWRDFFEIEAEVMRSKQTNRESRNNVYEITESKIIIRRAKTNHSNSHIYNKMTRDSQRNEWFAW